MVRQTRNWKRNRTTEGRLTKCIFVQVFLPTAHTVSASPYLRNYSSENTNEIQKKELLLGVLLGSGLNLLNSLREHLPDNLDDIKTRVRDTYGTASDRVSRASDVLRGEEDSQLLGKGVALLIGVGIGVGVGLLIAPASREEMRADIADKVSDFGERVREHAGKKPQGATGT